MLALTDAAIMTGGPDGIVCGHLLMANGQIEAVGDFPVPADCERIDAAGRVVTPAFVDAHSHAGLGGSVLGGGDSNENSGPVNPQLRVTDALNPYDDSLGDLVWGGVLTVGLLPGSSMRTSGDLVEAIGLLPGQGAAIHLDETAEMQILRDPSSVKLALGDHPKRFLRENGQPPATRMEMTAGLRRLFRQASATLEEGCSDPGERLRHEPLWALLCGELTAAIHTHRRRDIAAALDLITEFDLNGVLHHATEGHLAVDGIAAAGVPCCVGPLLFSRRGPELQNASLRTPGILARAGVPVALISDDPTVPGHYLPHLAGMAVQNGMEYADALAAITRVPAEILGVDDQVGTLEPGKRADAVLHRGDPLDVMSGIDLVLSDGVPIEPQMPGSAPSLREAQALSILREGDTPCC